MDEFFWPVTLIENCSADTSNHLTPAVFPLPGAFQKLIHKTKEIRLFFFQDVCNDTFKNLHGHRVLGTVQEGSNCWLLNVTRK